jgi:sugar phosphate isomerase/epimerase
MADLVATAWTSAGNTSPKLAPATSPVPIAERIEAVAAAGFIGMGLIADDLAAIDASIGFAALRKLVEAAGLRHLEIELLERWWIPEGEPGHTYDVRASLFDAATALRPAFIKIGSQNGPPCPDLSEWVAPLRELVEQAAESGTQIALETMPFSAIPTVPAGIELVSATGHSGVGVLVDAWHVFRAGTAVDELRSAIRPGTVFAVELDDAAPGVVGSLFDDTVDRRLLCGDGSFDLTGLIAVLREVGFDGPWGVEILSESFRALPVGEALRRAADSARRVLSPAR